MDYDKWLSAVDRELWRRTGGYSSKDFPDYDFLSAHRDEEDPYNVAEDVIDQEGLEDA